MPSEKTTAEKQIEIIFLASSLLLYSFSILVLNIFELENLGTFFYKQLILNHSFFLAGGLLAAINLRAWKILFSIIRAQEQLGGRRTKALGLAFFLAFKLFLLGTILLFFVLKLQEPLLSLLIGFIGYLICGALGTAIFFCLFQRQKFFDSNV